MTLGRTASNAIKIKTDGGTTRAVNCACCISCPPCRTDLTSYPSLLETLENATSVAINTGSALSSFTKTADGGFEATFTDDGDPIADGYISFNKPCKQLEIGVYYAPRYFHAYHFTHETCYYEQSGGLDFEVWRQVPTLPAVVNGVSFPMLGFFYPDYTTFMPSSSIVFTVS